MKCFSGIQPLNVLEVDWDITTICQYKCPYCYARKQYTDTVIINKRTIDSILTKINKAQVPIDLSILGGEPTLHPLLPYIVKNANCHSIMVYTNGETYVNLPENAIIFLTFHPTESNPNIFSKNCYLYHKTHDIRVILMNHPKLNDIYLDLPTGIPVETNQIFITKAAINPPKVKTTDNIRYKDETREYTELEALKINHFKGWNCRQSKISIDVYGNMRYPCLNHVDAFEHKTIVCTQQTCENPCYMEMLKYVYND